MATRPSPPLSPRDGAFSPLPGLPFVNDVADWHLLPLLDHAPSPVADPSAEKRVDSTSRRRARRAVSERRRRAEVKNETDALRAEAEVLTVRLACLRQTRGGTTCSEHAAVHLRQRRQAEKENAHIKRALAAVRATAQDLDALLSSGFVRTSGVNMRDLLHSYTHLTRDACTRARDFRALCSQEKLDVAVQTVTREMRLLRSTGTPQISVQTVASRPDEFAITLTTQLALDTTDLERAFVAAGQASMMCSLGWASFRQLLATPRAKETPASDIRYTVCDVQYASDSTGELVRSEEGVLTYWKLSPTGGVMVWDFVDVDELYPSTHSADARRHSTGALVVRRERCGDGVERVVCSTVCTRIFQFLPGGRPVVSFDTFGSAVTIAADIQSAAKLAQQRIAESLSSVPNRLHVD